VNKEIIKRNMAKTETEKQFDNLVSKIIFPHFKAIGYKKAGNNFRYYDREGEFGKIVNFQKSSFYGKDHIHFTVNVGLYLADFEFYHTGKKSAEKFVESVCAVRQRIGKLMNKSNTWYDIDLGTEDSVSVQKQLERDFLNRVIPYLNKVKTKEDIIYHLIIEGSDYVVARIKTLYYNGQRERALNILEQEYRGATDVKWLNDLKQELI
jgi:hypothetical protein